MSKQILITLFLLYINLPITLATITTPSHSGEGRGEGLQGQREGLPWPSLPATLFSEFKKNGNRVNYEAAIFERRRQLATIAMAEIKERKGRYMPDIINGLQVMMEESWWGIPAHYRYPVPLYDFQEVDLFNAESASLIVTIKKELRAELDKFSPEICKRIDKEVNHRILRPALGKKYWWKTAGMNWNPWICSNWLTCVLECESDSTRRSQAIKDIEGCMDSFISQYPDDGGCDEGTGYWDRAAASLYDCMQQLHDAGIDDSRYRNNPKVRNMAAYIYRMYIGNDYVVNFADAHENRSAVQLNVLYPFALYLDDAKMRGFAAYIAKQKEFFNNPSALYQKSGNFPTLARELRLMRVIDQLREEKPEEPLVESWLPNLQIMTLRSKSGLFLAFKGGHNDESHNHNDVGSFIVYANGEPLLIDAGVGEYTSKTFSNDRYSIWTMQSQYHNLPQINGIDQHDGKQYRAELVKHDKKSLTLDIAKAYPAEADVISWKRMVSQKGNAIELTEDYSLSKITAPTRLMFLTTMKPDVSRQGILRLGSHSLKYAKGIEKAEVEDISHLLDPVLKEMWGEHLYRIVLTVENKKTNNIKIRIE